MGLDSIEFILEIEHYFKINIPDKEAEKMITVQNAVDYLVPNLKMVNRNVDLKKELLDALNASFSALGMNQSFSLSDKIFDLIPYTDAENWNKISSQINLRLPFYKSQNSIEAFFRKLLLKKNIDPTSTSVDRFIDLIAAENYQKLLVKGALQNEYEIYIALMGIIIEKLGVYSYEVYPESSFTSDFGID